MNITLIATEGRSYKKLSSLYGLPRCKVLSVPPGCADWPHSWGQHVAHEDRIVVMVDDPPKVTECARTPAIDLAEQIIASLILEKGGTADEYIASRRVICRPFPLPFGSLGDHTHDQIREIVEPYLAGCADAPSTNHYDGDACWNALESAELAEPFALGCVIKYAWRYRHTRNTADLRKAIDYLERVIAMGECGE